MPAKWHKYSYSARIEERRFVLSIVVLVLTLVVTFAIIHNYLLTMTAVNADTMAPSVRSGDRVIATPLYGVATIKDRNLIGFIQPKRGDVVLLGPAHPSRLGVVRRSLDGIVAFLTFQRFHPFLDQQEWSESMSIRRLVAFPGDTIAMDKFVLHVKEKGDSHFLTEYEVSDVTYDLQMESLPGGWTDDLPLSGYMAERVLGPDEFFVLSDNRLVASDSRSWGPISAKRIKGKVLARYWPLNRVGLP